MARGIKGSGKKSAVKKTATRRRVKKTGMSGATIITPGPMMEALMAAANKPNQRLDRSVDARSMVLGALGSVLSDITNAVIALSQAAISAPEIKDTESRS